jgi:hypothetical protein
MKFKVSPCEIRFEPLFDEHIAIPKFKIISQVPDKTKPDNFLPAVRGDGVAIRRTTFTRFAAILAPPEHPARAH